MERRGEVRQRRLATAQELAAVCALWTHPIGAERLGVMFDAERQIRFLYPPVFLAASLLLGLRLDGNTALSDAFWRLTGGESLKDWREVGLPLGIATTAGGVVLVIASGFLISSITVVVLRLVFWARGRHYEAFHSEDYSKLRERLNAKAKPGYDDALYLSATLDHEVLKPNTHAWIIRRWSMLYLAANSVTAVAIAPFVGILLDVVDWRWWLITACAVAPLALFAWFARKDTMGMLRFQSERTEEDSPSSPKLKNHEDDRESGRKGRR